MISVNIFSSHGKYTLEGKITLRRIFTRTVLYYGEHRIYGRKKRKGKKVWVEMAESGIVNSVVRRWPMDGFRKEQAWF